MIQLFDQKVFEEHRAGWAFAIKALEPLHSDSGVRFDGCLEETFAWNLDQNLRSGLVPYRQPWVGFVHNPTDQPEWVKLTLLRDLVTTPAFVKSLNSCLGLFTLSETVAEVLREAFHFLPVSSLIHPTEEDVPQWDLSRFEENPKAIHVGWWLRSFVFWRGLTLTIPKILPVVSYWAGELERMEREATKITQDNEDYLTVGRFPDSEYDEALAGSIITLNFIAAAANNAVVEALARGTPIFCNRLPAIEEYLGREYPGFLSGPEMGIRCQDRVFLLECSAALRERRSIIDLSGKAFCRRFADSEVMRDQSDPRPVPRVSTAALSRWHRSR